jgi:hypothetical protein
MISNMSRPPQAHEEAVRQAEAERKLREEEQRRAQHLADLRTKYGDACSLCWLNKGSANATTCEVCKSWGAAPVLAPSPWTPAGLVECFTCKR